MVATIVSSRSSRNSTPDGALTSERCIVPAISRCETSTVTFSGMSVGRAIDVELARDVLQHAALLDPGDSSTPVISSATVVWIFSSSLTSSRSMCVM
jgi:hypothetical protein